MKITDIKTYILKVPLKEPFYSASMYFDYRKTLCVKVETDEGIVGWGEGGQFGPADIPKIAIEKVLKPLLIGENPLDTERLWYMLYDYTRDYGRKGGIIEGISALDIAFWDIKGKKLGCSVATLLGGYIRQQVMPYATGLYFKEGKPFEYYINEVDKYVQRGFGAIKVKIGSNSIRFDIELLKSIRKKYGRDLLLMVDANHAYNSYAAINIGRELEKLDILWFEEPVIPEDRQAYREIKNALDIAISAGECEYTHWGFKDILMNREIDIVQPDVAVAGGITACKKIADMAYLNGIPTIPHVWGSAITMHAALQLIATLPFVPAVHSPLPGYQDTLFEFDNSENPLRTEIIKNKECFDLKDHYIRIPNKPGLGLEIDETKIKEFTQI